MIDRQIPAAADLYGDLLDIGPVAKLGWRSYVPGLLMTGVAALAAAYLSEHYGAPLMLMGLLIGLAFNFVNADVRLHAGLGFASKTLLRWGIVLVGLQVTFAQIASLGWVAFVAIAVMIALVTLTGTLVARGGAMGSAFGTLAGGAVAICGASAALALSSVLGEKRTSQAQLTLVLVSVSAASAVAMSVYPILAHTLHLTDTQAGFLMGASIHDVAQALGAGYSYSDAAGQTASIVKLTRVAMLAPALAVVAWGLSGGGSQERRRRRAVVRARVSRHDDAALAGRVAAAGAGVVAQSCVGAAAPRGDRDRHPFADEFAARTGVAIIVAGDCIHSHFLPARSRHRACPDLRLVTISSYQCRRTDA